MGPGSSGAGNLGSRPMPAFILLSFPTLCQIKGGNPLTRSISFTGLLLRNGRNDSVPFFSIHEAVLGTIFL